MKGFIARIILFAAASILLSTSLWAQSAACVFLKYGAGYSAKMRVQYGQTTTTWSDTFTVNNYQCQSLASVTPGTKVIVQVHANAGNDQNCGSFVLASTTASVTYLASGTTLNVNCSMPNK
jgi:hypothetical protein